MKGSNPFWGHDFCILKKFNSPCFFGMFLMAFLGVGELQNLENLKFDRIDS